MSQFQQRTGIVNRGNYIFHVYYFAIVSIVHAEKFNKIGSIGFHTKVKLLNSLLTQARHKQGPKGALHFLSTIFRFGLTLYYPNLQ